MPTNEELFRAAESLALSLESAVPLATTRIEHIRVSGHAYQARALANTILETLQAPSKATTAPAMASTMAVT
jgi:hypothetical protein